MKYHIFIFIEISAPQGISSGCLSLFVRRRSGRVRPGGAGPSVLGNLEQGRRHTAEQHSRRSGHFADAVDARSVTDVQGIAEVTQLGCAAVHRLGVGACYNTDGPTPQHAVGLGVPCAAGNVRHPGRENGECENGECTTAPAEEQEFAETVRAAEHPRDAGGTGRDEPVSVREHTYAGHLRQDRQQ